MWYTHAYNRIAGFGGGILPPLPVSTEKEVPPWRVEEVKEEIDRDTNTPPPAEKQNIQKKLEALHTNGRFPVPPTSLRGINSPAAIEDQYQQTGNTGQGYEPQYM